MNYQNNINTYVDLTAYNADNTKDYPNVSYISGTDEVKYGSNILVTKHNIQTAGLRYIGGTNIADYISEIWIDGVKLPNVVYNYKFTTSGEHTIKYVLSDASLCGGISRSGLQIVKAIIPNSVTTIGGGFLNSCTTITNVNSDVVGECIIPDNVTSVGTDVNFSSDFDGCTGFTKVVIPSSVTFIGTRCFGKCTNLQSITVLATTPPTLKRHNTNSNLAFYDTNNCPIYVPTESVNAYKTADNWSTYASRIQAIPTT